MWIIATTILRDMVKFHTKKCKTIAIKRAIIDMVMKNNKVFIGEIMYV